MVRALTALIVMIVVSLPAHADEKEAAAYNAKKGSVSLIIMRHGQIVYVALTVAGCSAHHLMLTPSPCRWKMNPEPISTMGR